jgi:hypothetical protein
MKDFKNNIKLYFLNRDSGNYKTFFEFIFSNPENISLEAIINRIKPHLIDREYFYPKKWGFNLDLQEFDLLEEWCELLSIEETNEKVTEKRSVNELLEAISSS